MPNNIIEQIRISWAPVGITRKSIRNTHDSFNFPVLSSFCITSQLFAMEKLPDRFRNPCYDRELRRNMLFRVCDVCHPCHTYLIPYLSSKAARTVNFYRFARDIRKLDNKLGDVKKYLTGLVVEYSLSSSTQNQAFIPYFSCLPRRWTRCFQECLAWKRTG
jgi:hypothetical protein